MIPWPVRGSVKFHIWGTFMLNEIPFLGAGLSFRKELKEGILAAPERVDFLELILDRYINKPAFKEQEACDLARRFPLIIHGVDLSMGTDCPPNCRRMLPGTKNRDRCTSLCVTLVERRILGFKDTSHTKAH